MVVRIRSHTLKGYLLEEFLAYLIRNTGYRLLVHERQDPTELARCGNGVVVRGRGGEHQVDVLGQLKWIPAFTFPIRLFVEAKARRGRLGIGVVRKAIGIRHDLNQGYVARASTPRQPPIRRYNYEYAIFSTSGFSAPAARMALAHQISLVDLSGPGFQPLRSLLGTATALFSEGLKLEGIRLVDPGDDADEDSVTVTQHTLGDIRKGLRQALGTWPEDAGLGSVLSDRAWYQNVLEHVRIGLSEIGEYFVGMSNGPFMLVLSANEHERFFSFCERYPVHDVLITWRSPDRTQWYIEPVDANQEPAYRLQFGLPSLIADWVFDRAPRREVQRRALQAKNLYFSDITVYHFRNDRDRIFRLRYNAEATRGVTED